MIFRRVEFSKRAHPKNELVPVTKLAAFGWILLYDIGTILRHLSQSHTNMPFVNTKAACKQLGVGAATLRRWDSVSKS